MVILNLFIGVIMGGMDEAKKESEALARTERGMAGGGVVPPSDDAGVLLEKLSADKDGND